MKIIETIGAIILAPLYFMFWLLGETKEDIEARSEKTLIFSGGYISELNNELRIWKKHNTDVKTKHIVIEARSLTDGVNNWIEYICCMVYTGGENKNFKRWYNMTYVEIKQIADKLELNVDQRDYKTVIAFAEACYLETNKQHKETLFKYL